MKWIMLGFIGFAIGSFLFCVTLFFYKGPLEVRQHLGNLAQIGAPGYSFCHRCMMPWKFTEGHTTPYGKDITQMIKNGESINTNWGGCFPLCERCWQELGSGKKRLLYYRELWVSWQQWGHQSAEKWEHIKTSVLAGN